MSGFWEKLKGYLPVTRRYLADRLTEAATWPLEELLREVRDCRAELLVHDFEILNRQNFLVSELFDRKFDRAEIAGEMRDGLEKMSSLPEAGAIPVVFITDSGYLAPTRVAVTSLLRNRDPRTRYKVYVVAAGLTREEKESFGVFSSAVEVVDPGADSVFAGEVPDHPHVSGAALLKFHLPELFPNERKMLYLDSDMIVKGDLGELFRTELADAYAAVVPDATAMLVERDHVALGLKRYFNSGMMLLNLELMRRDGIAEKLVAAKKRHAYASHFMDQDEFNYVFNDKVITVSPKYNCMYANNIRLKASETARCYGLAYREYLHCLYSPVILHITNRDKPWDSPVSPHYLGYKIEELYFRALAGEG